VEIKGVHGGERGKRISLVWEVREVSRRQNKRWGEGLKKSSLQILYPLDKRVYGGEERICAVRGKKKRKIEKKS